MANTQLRVTSSAFQHEGEIPMKYTCDGEDINPPLNIENIPAEAKSLALIMEDPDAPKGTFTHWLVWNIEPEKTIAEDSTPGIVGTNNFGDKSYGGPCPPSGSHRYYFKVFALDAKLDLSSGADKKTLEQAIKPHIIAEGVLMGRYARPPKNKKTPEVTNPGSKLYMLFIIRLLFLLILLLPLQQPILPF